MKIFLKLFFSLLFVGFLSSCNDCKDVVCDNGGTCDDGICLCRTGYSGTNCEVEDLCITQNVTCENGGVCVDGECDCESYYYGETCLDYCVNGSYSAATGTCSCEHGYKGDDCTIIMRDSWIGTYSMADECNSNPGLESVITEKENPDNAEAVDFIGITNLTGLDDTKGYGYISNDTLYIPQQSVKTSEANGAQSYQVTGQAGAVLIGGQYTIEIKRKFGSFTNFCELNMTKQ
ncbi:MAG: hypothetical protein GWP27_07820 [Bacteroidetes bacterium]|nr:hypothetical protein [Bacteroidota bacterium]